MASLSLTSITPQPTTGFSLKNSNNYSNPTTKFLAKKRHVLTLATPSPQTSSSTTSEKPEIELEFLGPKPGSDGSYPVDKATAISGQKLLRNIMLDNNIELYAAYIVDGKDLLNERTKDELRYLKKKPESWRLACRTIVGNKENSGKVVVQRLPQWKK
ncbi:photosynthetic NDH subunit of subcomplex B 3, chloroplastic isoform X2 [Gossypium arboreum]|uniref:photosynthetic NDH subunit of subcomplex B 3, chloroplastic isoform X2 n=1 Tax=Gossypium arboreum TaxID=29729 RepID=UPI0008190015|nr:photosynthetic NDH subunit of subcomplex B 3, chloroplastic isoform X2 [Gossypium arboreum]